MSRAVSWRRQCAPSPSLAMAPKRKRKPRATPVVDDDGNDDAPSTSTAPSSPRVGLEHLPVAVLELILRRLDHDSLFTCAFVCKAWRDTLTRDLAGVTPEVWRTRLTEFVDANSDALCALDKDAARKPGSFGNPMSAEEWNSHERRKVRAHYAPLLAARTMCAPPTTGEELHFMHVHSGLAPSTGNTGPVGGGVERSGQTAAGDAESASQGAGPAGGASASDPTDEFAAMNPLELYKRLYQESCYDCREMKRRDDVTRNATWRSTAGSLRVRLCRSCSELYAYKPRGRMRLVTFTRCKDDWCLRPKDLEGLRYGLDTNPENASWAPMKLYRRVDVLERALARWKTRAGLEAELKRRALR